MREVAERRAWLRNRIHAAHEISKKIIENIETVRPPERLIKYYHEAELEGLFVGLRRGLWVNDLPNVLEDVPGLPSGLAQVDPGIEVVGDFAFRVQELRKYLHSHPELAREAGWGEDVRDDIRRLHSEVEESTADMTPEQAMKVGSIMGYPEECIRGFARELRITEQSGAPSPQTFWEHPKQIADKIITFSRDDQKILSSLLARQRQENARIITIPDHERIRARGKLQAENYERLRPHLSRWYQQYFGLEKSDADHLASKRRVELYLGNAPAFAMDFAAYGEESEEEKQLKQMAQEISQHL